MATSSILALMRTLSSAVSRRSLVAGLPAGLLASGIVRFGVDDAEARKNGKRRKKKRRKDKAKTSVVATCPGADLLTTNSDGNGRLAQTFVAVTSGPLVEARLPIFREPETAGDFELRLSPVDATSTPLNEILAVSIVAGRQVPDAVSDVDFSFNAPFTVTAGVEYALVLTRPGDGGFAWSGEQGSTCPGQSFFSPDQAAPFANNGAAFNQFFTAFVRS